MTRLVLRAEVASTLLGAAVIHAAQAREMLRASLRGDGHPLDDVYGFERLSRRNIFPARR